MFLGEPPATRYDLRFSIAGFPVRIHPWFWIAAIILGANGTSGENAGVLLLLWVGVLFVSILVHELGHALAFRWFHVPSRICLYMFGGVTVPDTHSRPWGGGPRLYPQAHIIISLAGPFAGFVLGGLVVVLIQALGGSILLHRQGFPFFTIRVPANADWMLWDTLFQLLWVNIAWGMVNLLPVFPLDGGHVMDVLLTTGDPYNGRLNALRISFVTALVLAIVGFIQFGSLFIALLFGSLAYSNYMAMRFSGGRPW